MASKCVSSTPLLLDPHLTGAAAYFTQATVDSLGTVDDIPVLKDLVVPEGLFKSSRRTKTRSSRANTSNRTSDGTPDLSAQVGSSGKTGGEVSPVVETSSTPSRPTLQIAAQQSTSPLNQGLPPSPYPQDLFNGQSPNYSGLSPNPAQSAQQHDAYARLYGDSYTPSPQAPEGFHIPPAPQVQPHVPLGYNWPAVPMSPPDNTCQSSPYPYPMLVASQNVDSTFHSSPAHSQVYVYGSTSQASPSSLYHYRTVSPALSHAPSQFSTSSQSQSSSESDSPAPRPVRTPFFSPEPMSGQLSNDVEPKFEPVTLEGIQEHDGGLDVGLAPLSKLKRFHPYRRDPLDDLFVQSLGSRPV